MKIYVATSMTLYNTHLYERIRRTIYKHHRYGQYHSCTVLFASDLYASTNEWLKKWPKIVQEIDELIFFTDKEGYIGRGVYTEAMDTIQLKKPVYLMLLNGTKIPYHALTFTNGSNWKQFKKISVC